MRLARAPHVFRTVAPAMALALLAGCTDQAPTAPAAESAGGPSASVIAPPGFIRIGVVPESNLLHVGGTGAYRLVDDVTGAVLLTGSASQASVVLDSRAVSTTFWRVQIQCSGNAPYVADWVLRVAAAGYEPYTEYVAAARCWRMRVGRFPTRTAALAEQAELYRLGLAPAASGGAAFQVTITEGVTKYIATLGSVTAETTNPIRIEAIDGRITINGVQYRGIGEVRVNSLGSLAGINELSIEDYLLGVVPRELGPIAFPYLEALKAQSVAARTYAVANMGKRRNDGYDLLATTSDQVYGGYSAEHPLSNEAVVGTAGVVATYNGVLISTLYSSTSGGFTANSEDVFANAFPYLRGVPDAERGKALEHVPSLDVFKRNANPKSLRNAANGDFEADWSSRHRWYVDWTADEMRTALSNYFGRDVGRVLAIEVPARANSGRALRMEFVTETGTYAENKDRIRSALKWYSASGALNSLYSTLVYVEPVVDNKTKEIIGFEAWGGGWGHGVGLSQTGAVGMAEKGYTYDEILKHYYQGIALETR